MDDQVRESNPQPPPPNVIVRTAAPDQIFPNFRSYESVDPRILCWTNSEASNNVKKVGREVGAARPDRTFHNYQGSNLTLLNRIKFADQRNLRLKPCETFRRVIVSTVLIYSVKICLRVRCKQQKNVDRDPPDK